MFFLHKNVVKSYIIYKVDTWSRNSNTDFTLDNCLCGVVKLTKNANLSKYGYSGYGTGFDARLQVLWTDGSWHKNVLDF